MWGMTTFIREFHLLHVSHGNLVLLVVSFKWEVLGSIIAKSEFEPYYC